ncbi:hypothetical protein Blue_048 [Bacillus phage Deep Blue]|uniref:Uncharacterized protein n=1 Tax=Bacillus phage Deep Blue TaxID=1792245 RepID=A0A140HLK9_9CAUD|nr:hypothetical protein Blue_048 [Bacillus phage Deep Blue]AMO25871.1 hypothetical protein Blue_048 [Bacillus phage Deep Blue]
MGTQPKIYKFNKQYLEDCINGMEKFTPHSIRDLHHQEAYLFTLRELLKMLEEGVLLGYQEEETK